MDQELQCLVEEHETAANWRRGVERTTANLTPVTGALDLFNTAPDRYFPSIRERAALLCDGGAEAADRIADQFDRAHRQLTANLEVGVAAVRRDARNWEGSAADDFARYVDKVEQAYRRTDEALEAFGRIQQGFAALVAQARREAVGLIEDATEVHREQWGRQAVTRVFEITGFVVEAVGTAASGGALLPAVLTIATSASPLVDAVLEEDNSTRTAESLDVALGKLLEYVDDQQECFVRAVRKVREHLSGDNLPYVDPAPPAIVVADTFDPDTFRLPDGTVPDEVMVGVSRDPLIPKPTREGDGDRPSRIGARLDVA